MSTKQNDRVHLIENQASVHKSRQRDERKNQQPETKKKESRRDKQGGSVSSKPSPVPPVTTVVISSSTGVHVAQSPPPQTHAVDKRTGRYLALGVTVMMVFITLYHTFLRQVPMLAGLVPPAIIMVLYLIWIIYFAKKRKRQVQIELV